MTDGGSQATRSPQASAMVHDVHLKSDNCFRGQLPPEEFSESRQGVLIRFYHGDHLIAETKTDRLGRFTLRYLPPGTGTLVVSVNGTAKACFCRLWAPGTSPPVSQAKQKETNLTTRAQNLHVFPTMSFQQVASVAGVVGGAVATPIVWHNIQQDHKAPVSASSSDSLILSSTQTTTTVTVTDDTETTTTEDSE